MKMARIDPIAPLATAQEVFLGTRTKDISLEEENEKSDLTSCSLPWCDFQFNVVTPVAESVDIFSAPS